MEVSVLTIISLCLLGEICYNQKLLFSLGFSHCDTEIKKKSKFALSAARLWDRRGARGYCSKGLWLVTKATSTLRRRNLETKRL